MIEKEFFTAIETQNNSQLPFVAYRKPNESFVKAILQKDDAIHTVSDFTESGFVFSPFDSEKNTILFPLEQSKMISCEYFISSEISNVSKLERKKEASNNSEIEQEQHLKLVEQGIKAIKEGRFEKVVLSRVEGDPISEENPIEIFQNLLKNYPTAFVYLWYHPEIGLWLGATPETLLKIDGQRFKTMSLAGTKKYDDTIEKPWGTKEIDEQQIVTDYIVNNLRDIVRNINVTTPKTIKAGELLHLQTKISGILKLGDLKKVIETLHPTPAICGLPKIETKSFILNNENYNREYYTGFLGELNVKSSKTRNKNRRNVENNAYNLVKTTSELFVNLRCMQIKKQQALIYVGGGITKDSNPELEWEETVNKTQTMLRVLN
ncbi:chorismate-binding protein [Psychroserpens sp. AS72]|uniref:chorismate-binding protein n=1 Tax=Psychroserpens sp. AS72 TaxID=3135775 RepID=UPI0031793B87